MHFYEGGKITKGPTGDATLVDSNGQAIQSTKLSDNTNTNATMMFEHYNQCLQHCQMLEQVLSNLDAKNDCFPLIVGRRPSSAPVLGPIREQNANLITPKALNVRRTLEPLCSFLDYSVSLLNNLQMPSFASSILSRPQSAQLKMSPIGDFGGRSVNVPGIGVATQVRISTIFRRYTFSNLLFQF